MEPMALGSPGSPSPAASTFLPSYLMGESNAPTMPRNNTLSPTKGRTLAFAQSPTSVSTPPDFNRSGMQVKSLHGYQQTPPTNNFNATAPNMGHNNSLSGPPTQGLFDSLRAEKTAIQTSTRTINQSNQSIGGPNQSFNFNQSVNDSYLNQSDFQAFNTSRITSPLPSDFRHSSYSANISSCVSPPRSSFWITVFGFPQSATSMILSHFSQCGTIIDKIFPPHSGNYVHLKFSSRLESDKAITYNEKILGNCLMIGVTHCKDPTIVDKENQDGNQVPINRVRPLTHIAYKNAQSPSEVIASPTAPKRSSGLINKALDVVFGW